MWKTITTESVINSIIFMTILIISRFTESSILHFILMNNNKHKLISPYGRYVYRDIGHYFHLICICLYYKKLITFYICIHCSIPFRRKNSSMAISSVCCCNRIPAIDQLRYIYTSQSGSLVSFMLPYLSGGFCIAVCIRTMENLWNK